MTIVGKIISIISGLLAVWKTWLMFLENRAKEQARDKETKRDAAIDDFNKAQTEDEANRASDAIHNNRP